MTPPTTRFLMHLAWWNVGLHVAALALAWFCLRPGSPAFALDVRRAYLAGYPVGWGLAWGVWMLCALLQVAFYAELGRHLLDRRDTVRLAVSLACAGVGVDLLCDTIWIVVIPDLAARGPDAEAVFVALERLAAAGGLVVANGLYVLAAFLLTLCLRGRPGLIPGTLTAGYGVLLFGMMLTVSGFTRVQWHAEAATGPTILCFCAWVVLAAYSVRKAGGTP